MVDDKHNPKSISDAELSACLAAVQTILEDEARAAACDAENTSNKSHPSAWHQQMLLEGSGRAGRLTSIKHANAKHIQTRQSLWRRSNLPGLFLTFALTSAINTCLAPLSAQAKNWNPEFYNHDSYGQQAPIIPEADVMTDTLPPTAPDINRYRLGPPLLQRPPMPGPNAGFLNAADKTPGATPTSNLTNDLADVLGGSYSDSNGDKIQLVRVALSIDSKSTQIVVPDGAILKDAATGDILAQLPAQSRWQIASRYQGGFGQLAFSGQLANAAAGPVLLAQRPNSYSNVALSPTTAPKGNQLTPLSMQNDARFYLPQTIGRAFVLIPPAPDGTIAIGNNVYRGGLMIRPHKPQTFSLINLIDLEDYLLSVVPSEMPSSWSLEALKAQAIAARSYAVACIGKHGSDGYDLKQTIEDQVYSGVNTENAASSEAVAETRGIVMRCQGQVITAYFHSTSGGYTELSENVWTKPLPYLKAVPDYDDASPHFSWNKSYSVSTVEQLLASNGKNVGALSALVPVARGVSPRVKVLLATGSNGSAYLTGEEARRIFSLPSSCFNVCGATDTYVFAGRGFGHGLGMSQWGAKRLAEAGYNAEQILSYYYKDIAIERP